MNNQHNNASILTRLLWLLAVLLLPQAMSAQTEYKFDISEATEIIGETGSNSNTGITGFKLGGQLLPEFSISCAKNTGGNPPRLVEGKSFRIYVGNTATFTAPSGELISQISLNCASIKGSLTSDTGDIELNTAGKQVIWTAKTPVKSVTFTGATSANVQISEFVFVTVEDTGGGEEPDPGTDPDPSGVAAPTFSPEPGVYYSTQTVTITSPGNYIYYSTDGSDPKEQWSNYGSPYSFTISSDKQIRAIAQDPNTGDWSEETTGTYTIINIPMPSISPTTTYFADPFRVTISSHAGYTVRYTLDGSEPTMENGTVYTTAFMVGESCTVKAACFDREGHHGDVRMMEYIYSKPGIGEGEYNPNSPSDPSAPELERKFRVIRNYDPAFWEASSSYITVGENTSVYASSATGWIFDGWWRNGEQVGTDRYYSFTMPEEDVVMTARYHYDPNSPSDPSEAKLQHPLTVTASPAKAGSFNFTTESVTEGDTRDIWAYPATNWEFTGWEIDGVPSSGTDGEINSDGTAGSLTRINVTMGQKPINVVGKFRYNPSSPANPNENYWNANTGQMIIDHFTPGRVYDVASRLAGSGNLGNVGSLILKGKVNNSDLAIGNSLPNVDVLDFTRTAGVTEIPSNNFRNSSASTISLPASVTRFNDYVFQGAQNLVSLSVHSTVPPTTSLTTFSGFDPSNCVLRVPKESIELYWVDPWSRFATIQPLAEEVHTLKINLPEGYTDGRLKGYRLELVNERSGARQKYVVTDRPFYTFSGLLEQEQYTAFLLSQQGLTVGKIEGILMPASDFEATFEKLKEVKEASVKVLTPEGTDVTASSTIEWFEPKADGTEVYLRKTDRLGDIPVGQELKVKIGLDQANAMLYRTPEAITFTMGEEGATLQSVLESHKGIELTGTVHDASTGSPIAGADVSVTQTLNGKYSKSYTARTGSDGRWSMKVAETPEYILTVSADECVTLNETVTSEGEVSDRYDIGRRDLRSIVGARVYYTMTIADAGTETASEYTDSKNVGISVYNETQQRPHNDISIQYPMVVILDENVNPGDVIRLTASSRNGDFAPVERTARINDAKRGEVLFDFIGKGGIKARYEMTDNQAVVGMLFNEAGNLMQKADYNEASASFLKLDEGNYTLVSMGRSQLINSVNRLSTLGEMGLKEGTEYVSTPVEVRDGTLSEVSLTTVPPLDESLFTFTGTSTYFTSNKTSMAVSNYLTLKAKVDFKAIYSQNVNNVTLEIDLPKDMEVVTNSVLLDNRQTAYTVDGDRLSVDLGNNWQGQLKLCVIALAGGEKAITGSVRFDLDGTRMAQTIGSVTPKVEEMLLNVPSQIASSEFTASGKTTPNSSVKVLVDGKVAGQTKALANGNWSAECALPESGNLTTHSVSAEVETKDGLTLHSETREILFSRYEVMPRNVTMTFYNGWTHKNIDVNFNFETGLVTPSSYDFYHETDFTFVADFTNNDPEILQSVTLHVYTDHNNVYNLDCTYDENSMKWFATRKFGTQDLPNNLSISYLSANGESALIDLKQLQEVYAEVPDLAASYREADAAHEAFVSGLEEVYANGDISAVEEYVSAYDSTLGYEPTTSEGNQDLLDRIEAGATPAEQLAIARQEYEAIKSRLAEEDITYQEAYEKYGDLKDEIDYTFTSADNETYRTVSKSAEGMTADALLADGWHEVKIGESPDETFSLYVRSTDTSIEYVDFRENIYKGVFLEGGVTSMKKAQSEDAFAKFEETVNKINDAIQTLNKLATAVVDFVDEFTDVFSAKVLQLDKDIKIFESMAATSREMGYLEGSGELLESARQYEAMAADLKAQRTKWLDRMNSVKEFKSTVFLKKANFFLALTSGLQDIYNWWDLLKRINAKIPCEANPEYALDLRSDIIYYGGLVCTLDIIDVISSVMALKSAVAGVVAAPATGGSSAVIGGVGALVLKGVGIIANLYASYRGEKEYKRLDKAVKKLKCNKDDKDTDNGSDTPPPYFDPTTPIMDPSGYVYEGVPSNRLEGVQATCYYREEVEDMYGDKELRVVLWNAEEYAQENPLFTDENGMYRWDVPQGEWQVKFEKDGYVTTYSDWLPVPPPQLEVNIAMTQNSQPEVESVRAYADGVEMTFDKYMDPETLTTANIYVTAGRKRLNGTIELMDAEIGDALALPDDASAKRYARTVRFVPEQSLSTSEGEITLFVKSDVRSYAGIPMTETFSQVFDIEKEVKEIVAESELIKVLYGGDKEIVVSALPYDAAVGRTLRVANSSPMIASVDTETVTLDENGQATIRVHGELPGTAGLTFTIDDVRVTGTGTLNVVTELIEAVAPRASRASGTAVYRGTKVELTSETEDAEIYFTTDGSCPCDADGTRRRYSVPFVIDGDLNIKAIAVVQNEESPVADFNYTLKRTAVSPSAEEGWNWISHNLENEVALGDLAGENVDVIKGQDTESVRDPQLGLVGGISALTPGRGYKLHTTERSDARRLEDVAYNPATPFELHSGWNWIGYPLDQTMTLDEAFAPTEAETEDYVIGQNGFAIFDGESWTGELTTLSPGQGYMYYSKSGKELVYNTSIVSNANSLYATSAVRTAPWIADRRKYADAMPVIAELVMSDGHAAEAESYFVGAFCGTECRGVGRWVDGRLMMNVWGRPGDELSFRIADAFDMKAEESVASTVIGFTPEMTGSLTEPLQIRMGNMTGIESVKGDSPFSLLTEGDLLRVSGPTDLITEISLYTTDGMKVLSAASLPDGTLSLAGLRPGVHVVSIAADENYSYYKIVVK